MDEFNYRYLAIVHARLLAADFEVEQEQGEEGFSLVARRPYGPARGVGFGPPLVVFSTFDHLDPEGLRVFSDSALAYLRAEHPKHALRGVMLYCPVAVVKQCDPTLIDAVVSRAGAKKYKRFVSFPIVIDPRSGDAYYYRRTPIVGAVFYRGFRRLASTVIADPEGADAAAA
jgi:hypothetical protein